MEAGCFGFGVLERATVGTLATDVAWVGAMGLALGWPREVYPVGREFPGLEACSGPDWT